VTSLRGFGRAWDRISVYLPVILMGLLALGTYWLARSTPGVAQAFGERAPTHEPDYFLRGFSVKTFDPSGRLRSEIQGVEARHFPDTDTTEIDQPRIRAFNDKGALTVATANRAIANGDASQVQLIGNAVVTREAPPPAKGQAAPPRLEIRGEFLHAFMNEERVRSDRPVTLRRGEDQFEAEQMVYDNLDRVLQMEGRVRGTLQPGGAR
jgi:lipopolysaccharide export system protein LptC